MYAPSETASTKGPEPPAEIQKLTPNSRDLSSDTHPTCKVTPSFLLKRRNSRYLGRCLLDCYHPPSAGLYAASMFADDALIPACDTLWFVFFDSQTKFVSTGRCAGLPKPCSVYPCGTELCLLLFGSCCCLRRPMPCTAVSSISLVFFSP